MAICSSSPARRKRRRVLRNFCARWRVAGGRLFAVATVIAWSEATKQSNSHSAELLDGLLRGACHRARVRATRWLAMPGERTASLRSRGPRPPDKAGGIPEAFDHDGRQVFCLVRHAGAGAHGVANKAKDLPAVMVERFGD